MNELDIFIDKIMFIISDETYKNTKYMLDNKHQSFDNIQENYIKSLERIRDRIMEEMIDKTTINLEE